ncbi:Tonsoku-like protein [Cryptotermes secundus]|uniref:Tonsoku-like protein n=1 Tax=Cryptotermes secundus TaxID=105785 RepID=A0A2J7PCX9_9NEOP|nr:tonsoku-like protein isoform X2 [Cryptotermes secundus]PNF14178.1 Tonsoku-like protein [Cryptotermes secundus]
MEEQKYIRRKTKAKSEGNLEQLSHACNKLGELHFKHSSYEDALKEYKEEATVYETLGSVIRLAVAHRMIGEVYTSMGKYDKALKHQLKHLELARSEASQIEEQRALATIGRTYFCQAESIVNDDELHQSALTNAKNAYMKSLDLCERLRGIGNLEHMEMRARLLLNIGLVLECQHDIQKAIDNIQNAVQICKEHDLFEDLFRCYSSLGMLYYRQLDSSKALHMLELALDVASRLEDKIQLSCEVSINKAEVLFSLPDFRAAKQALRHAYKLNTPIESDRKTIAKNLKLAIAMCDAEEQLQNVPDTDYITKKKLYETMGDGCVTVKNYARALEYYRMMLKCAEAIGESGQQLAAVYVSLSQTYKDNEQYDLSLEFFRKELELWENNPAEACKTMLSIGEVLELQGACYEELEETYNRARQLAQQASSLTLEAMVLRVLEGVQKLKGHDALALETQRELQLIDRNAKDETSGSEDEEASPDIGHDICLETYTDSESENEEFDRPNQPRRPVRLKVRKNEKGETQLHLSCMNGNLALVKKLVEQGHPVNIRDHCGWLPLHEACNHGHRDIVEFLIDKGAALNDRGGSQCGGVTPLHDAASCGHLDVMELLLDRGASVVSRTNEGDTPLDCLVKWYQRTDIRFGPVEQTFFEEIQMRLRTALEKAGHHVGNLTPPSTDGISTYSHKKKRSRPAAALSRMVDDASLGDEDAASRWRQTHPKSDVILHDDPPALHHQDIDADDDDDDGWIGSGQEMQNAGEEYRNVMTMLRKKEQTRKEPSSYTEVKEVQGFLAEDDVGEDWLDDDMAGITRPNKKRRLAAPIEKHRSHPNVITGLHKCRSLGGLKVLQQSVLPDMGLTTIATSQSIKSLESVVPGTSKPSELAASQLVRVRVENRLLLVPVTVPEQQTIGWLAREAARRYYSVEGLQPSLSLSTKDGALLSEDDPVLLVGSEEVMCTVISWNIPPLTDRYMESCQALCSAPDTHIIACLEVSQATQILQLSNLALPASQMAPLFRALNRQHTLQQLLLGGNCFGDYGVKLLVAGLPTLSNLQELDLSCNNISADGILHLSTVFSNTTAPALQALARLDLSHNPLGDGAVKHMNIMLPHLVSLTVLQLQDCHLTTNCFKSEDVLLCLDSIRVLDVSYNALGGSGLLGFLGRLCPTEIVSLNLGATTACDGQSVAREVILMFTEKEGFSKLTTLNLSNCGLRDVDIWHLLRVLQKCGALETLQLSGNAELSSVSLRRLLQHQPALRTVDLSGCTSIANFLGDSSPQLWVAQKGQKKLESLTLNSQGFDKDEMEALWWEAWGPRACIHRAPGGLLYLSLKE